ncbi:hypothetical protein T03_17900, partial [Trichinella britovi]
MEKKKMGKRGRHEAEQEKTRGKTSFLEQHQRHLHTQPVISEFSSSPQSLTLAVHFDSFFKKFSNQLKPVSSAT